MNQLLKKLTFVQAILLVSLIPFAGMVVEFLINLKTATQRISDAKATVEIIQVANILDGVAHEHAVERGLTAGFLGSGGVKNGDKLQAQRQKADTSVATIAQLTSGDIKQIEMADINDVLLPLKEALAIKEETRKNVDALSPNSNAFNVYSTINTEALDAIGLFMLGVKDPSLKQQLDNLVSILWLKERAGQVRGKLNAIFAKGQINSSDYHKVVGYLADEQRLFKRLARFATAEDLQKLNAFKDSDTWQEVEFIQITFRDSTDSGAITDPADGQWFELATARIKDIKSIADTLVADLSKQAEKTYRSELNGAIIQSVIIGIVVILLILLNWFTIRSLKARVAKVDGTLESVSRHCDLTLRLADDSNDEFGNISQSIDSHLDEMNGIFNDFKTTSSTTMAATDSITASTEQSRSNAESQHERTEQMSQSMYELSQSATEIADNMVHARNSMQEANQNAQKSRSESDAVRHIFAQVMQDFSSNLTTIEELAQHSQEISSILDTISGIAEQTNLLALNAAIEAARAGEQGRGFAVVADEVRSLAQKTQESTANIRDMIERLGNSSQQALDSMRNSQARVEETEGRVINSDNAVVSVNDEIQKVQDMIQLVATAAEQQSAVIREMEEQVAGMNGLSNDTLKNIQSVDSAAQDLTDKLGQLDTRIQSFKV